MNELVFSEAIKVKDGVFYNLPLHESRLQNTAAHFFDKTPQLSLSVDMIPENLRCGIVKCRVCYSSKIISVDFTPYTLRVIQSLQIVNCDQIDYFYKSTNRNSLNELYSQRGDADDVLIVKNGLITDSSSANVVFENANGELFTSTSFLLPGTKRKDLLDRGIIKECEITVETLSSFTKVYLINAMIDLEDNVSCPVSSIIL